MYRELGGRPAYLATPIAELIEIQLSMAAESNVQKQRDEEAKAEQDRKQAEMERKARQGGMR